MSPFLGLRITPKICLGLKKVAQTAKCRPIWSPYLLGRRINCGLKRFMTQATRKIEVHLSKTITLSLMKLVKAKVIRLESFQKSSF